MPLTVLVPWSNRFWLAGTADQDARGEQQAHRHIASRSKAGVIILLP